MSRVANVDSTCHGNLVAWMGHVSCMKASLFVYIGPLLSLAQYISLTLPWLVQLSFRLWSFRFIVIFIINFGVFNFFRFSFNYINYLVDLLRKNFLKKMKESVGNPLHLKSVNHVSLVCRNISESIDFYQNVLGFVPIRRPGSFNFDGAW